MQVSPLSSRRSWVLMEGPVARMKQRRRSWWQLRNFSFSRRTARGVVKASQSPRHFLRRSWNPGGTNHRKTALTRGEEGTYMRNREPILHWVAEISTDTRSKAD